MSESWENAQKRLQELKRKLPEPLLIQLTYYDNSKEVLSLDEVLKKDNNEWKMFEVVKGNNKKEIKCFLEWLAPDNVIL